jgi:hypothetical protein
MAIITHLAKTGRVAAAELQSTMQGEVFLPHDENYDRNHLNPRLLSNGTEDNLPAVIARCETRRDIQSALRTARAHGLAVIVRDGEHDYSGRALKPGELVVDLSAMRQVAVHPDTRVAIVAGGATVKDVVTAAAAHGLAAVTGICGPARMASLKLDGGYGPLLGRYGLAADNVLEAEIVLKSGQHVIANADRNRDLFRTICARGADFGVVTSLHVRLRALPSLLGGMIFYAWSDADLVLRGYSALAASAPDHLTISAGIVSAANGNPLLFVAPTWCGEMKEGEHVLAGLQAFGNPLAAIVGTMSYPDLLAIHDRYIPKGPRYSTHRRYLPALTDRAISAMIIAANARTSPLSAIVLHHFRGRATRLQSEAGAFGVRDEHFLLEAIAAWEPTTGDQAACHQLWAQNLSDALAPAAMAKGYANLLELDDHNDR